MKEPTIEQKVKAYDEALERAKIWQGHLNESGDKDYAEELSYIFPELKESEDERIRKNLIELFHDTVSNDEIFSDYGLDKTKVLAWLEKQDIFSKKDIDDAYLKGVRDTKNEIEKQYEANYQIRKDIATFIFNYKGDIKDRAKWMNYLGIKVSFVEKQGEQKPAWSEEDEHRVKDTIYFLDTAKKHYASVIELDACIDWLKSLKKRLQK